MTHNYGFDLNILNWEEENPPCTTPKENEVNKILASWVSVSAILEKLSADNQTLDSERTLARTIVVLLLTCHNNSKEAMNPTLPKNNNW